MTMGEFRQTWSLGLSAARRWNESRALAQDPFLLRHVTCEGAWLLAWSIRELVTNAEDYGAPNVDEAHLTFDPAAARMIVTIPGREFDSVGHSQRAVGSFLHCLHRLLANYRVIWRWAYRDGMNVIDMDLAAATFWMPTRESNE